MYGETIQPRPALFGVLMALSACGNAHRPPSAATTPPATNRAPSTLALAAVRDSTVDVDGYYMFVDPAPAWAADLDYLSLTTLWPHPGSDGAHVKLDTVPLTGILNPKRDSTSPPKPGFVFTHARRDGRHLTFLTTTVGSISYDFDGQLLKLADLANGDTVLTGHLRMLRDGKVVAEAEVKFSYFTGD